MSEDLGKIIGYDGIEISVSDSKDTITIDGVTFGKNSIACCRADTDGTLYVKWLKRNENR